MSNIERARHFLNELATAARLDSTNPMAIEVEKAHEFASGYVRGLVDFEVITSDEAKVIARQMSAWPSPLKNDGTIWGEVK